MAPNLFHTAFKALTRGNTTSVQRIRGAFFIARNFSNERAKIEISNFNLLHEALIQTEPILPDWFPWNGNIGIPTESQSSSPGQIICRDDLMNVLTRCTATFSSKTNILRVIGTSLASEAYCLHSWFLENLYLSHSSFVHHLSNIK